MAGQNIEAELNDLLDSALDDFDANAPKAKAAAGKEDTKAEASKGAAAEAAATDDVDDPDVFFSDETKQYLERMAQFLPPMDHDDPIRFSLEKMAEATTMAIQGESTCNDEEVAKCSKIISKALMGLQEGTEGIHEPISGDDVSNMFSALHLDGIGDGEANNFLPLMDYMMQSILSAEILLPSVKDLIVEYTKYFEENGDKISAEDKERYEQQLDLFKVILGHLESEKPDDGPEVKREKFKTMLDIMRKLPEYGQPPKEILARTSGDLSALENNLAGPSALPQCPTM